MADQYIFMPSRMKIKRSIDPKGKGSKIIEQEYAHEMFENRKRNKKGSWKMARATSVYEDD